MDANTFVDPRFHLFQVIDLQWAFFLPFGIEKSGSFHSFVHHYFCYKSELYEVKSNVSRKR